MVSLREVEAEVREQVASVPVTALYRPVPPMVVVEKVEGETIPRRFRKSYLTMVEARECPVDLSYVEPLQRMVLERCRTLIEEGREGMLPVALLLAYEHLENAKNEALDVVIREQHFDIAGSKLWDYANVAGSDGARLTFDRYMAIFRKAGGI